jgi:exodeoxyribonuclease VII small subunit
MADFESDLARLRQITERLSSGEEGLEKSMELYTEGMKLSEELLKRLEKYRTKIEILESGEKEA